MDYFVEKATFVLRAIQGGAGAYSDVGNYGLSLHDKNRQKLKKHKTV